jgi:hypothetical protein
MYSLPSELLEDRMNYKLLSAMCGIATVAAISGCGHNPTDVSTMDKAHQVDAFKADPSKMPDSVKKMLAQQQNVTIKPAGSSN